MTATLVVGFFAVWIGLAVATALLLGRAVKVADRRRPRASLARPRRAAAAIGRVVAIATGSIPVIGPRVVAAMTGAIPTIRP